MITSSPILQNSETPNSESKKVFSALSASLRLYVRFSTEDCGVTVCAICTPECDTMAQFGAGWAVPEGWHGLCSM